MARSVHLSEEAYALLRSLKEGGESFSDVVLRLAGSRKDPRRLLNLSRTPDSFDLEQVREAMARADQERLEALFGTPGGGP